MNVEMEKKVLKKLSLRELPELYFFGVNGEKIKGKNQDMSGNCSWLSGDCTKLRGDCSGLRGNCTGLRGYCIDFIRVLKTKAGR